MDRRKKMKERYDKKVMIMMSINNSLRQNQREAIKISVENDFEHGVHYHTTGSGKTAIGLNILLEFHKKYQNHNIMWICEYKSVLKQQFDKKTLKKNGFQKILDEFIIMNYSQDKSSSWIENINSAQFWKKPIFLIINRSFLTRENKYKRLKISIGLILQDECHTTNNSSSQQFYRYVFENWKSKCIGFSATPRMQNKFPFENCLSSFSIYDSYEEKITVAPKIEWLESTDKTLSIYEKGEIVKSLIQEMVYKKIIVWCGMMDRCKEIYKIWKPIFHDYYFAYDTSQTQYGYDYFLETEERAILFCAAKHREGSDIKNLDVCVFMDGVIQRSPQTFMQCMGRVLRKDQKNLKTHGLIIDLEIKYTSQVIQRIHRYLHRTDFFPWIKSSFVLPKNILIHSLLMTSPSPLSPPLFYEYDLKKYFKREIPRERRYEERIEMELKYIKTKKMIEYLLRAVEILEMTKDIPHITRGSCGSSLICYLLGISHVDPVLYNIRFARFMNEYRNTIPDIDFDFPYNKRDEVFMRLELRWPNKIARISNHVFFHEKSALRRAIRNSGYRQFIGKDQIQKVFHSFSSEQRYQINKEMNQLRDTFRTFSLHCGGIVYYPDGIPEKYTLSSSNILKQITWNKHDVAKHHEFKIDILANRALALLYDCQKELCFDNCTILDKKVIKLLGEGDSIGIPFAESPLIRQIFMKIRPQSIEDIAKCLAIIRPAAKEAKKAINNEKENLLIFDDDAIDMIAKLTECSDGEADQYRRAFIKNDSKMITLFFEKLQTKNKEEIIKKLIQFLQKYSFCKSHSFSYAQLVYQCAFMKTHCPERFWTATLKHCKSSYRKWVHLYEARLWNIFPTEISSIFAQNRRKKFHNLSHEDQLRKYGYWDMKTADFFPDCHFSLIQGTFVSFRGIIASVRTIRSHKQKKKHVVILGVHKNHYITVEWINSIFHPFHQYIGMYGTAIHSDLHTFRITDEFNFF